MSRLEPKRALLLGMVYSTEMEAKRGQEYRDRVRCEALETLKYQVFTLDNKHGTESSVPERHCRANFADPRRMLKAMHSSWGEDVSFDLIVLDYFFCPVGWARERWAGSFFKDTLPLFAESGLLKPKCQLWLPYLECVEIALKIFQKELRSVYEMSLVKRPKKNPLYSATEKVEDELLRCPDALTNETQLKPLLMFSETPFCMLQRLNEEGENVEVEKALTPTREYLPRESKNPNKRLRDDAKLSNTNLAASFNTTKTRQNPTRKSKRSKN